MILRTYDLRTGKLVAVHAEGKPPAPANRLPCAYLGEPTGETRLCPSCQGNVKVKLRQCAVYGDCATDKQLPGKMCCLTCPHYTPGPAPKRYSNADRIALARVHKLTPDELDAIVATLPATHLEEFKLTALDDDLTAQVGGILHAADLSGCGCCDHPGSGSSGSPGSGPGPGSGGGGPGIQTTCCDLPVPVNLRVTFSGGVGSLACLNGRTYLITYQPADNAPAWYWPDPWDAPGDDCTTNISYGCVESGFYAGLWVINATAGNALAGSYSSEANCNPFSVSGTAQSGVTGESVNWTVTE